MSVRSACANSLPEVSFLYSVPHLGGLAYCGGRLRCTAPLFLNSEMRECRPPVLPHRASVLLLRGV